MHRKKTTNHSRSCISPEGFQFLSEVNRLICCSTIRSTPSSLEQNNGCFHDKPNNQKQRKIAGRKNVRQADYLTEEAKLRLLSFQVPGIPNRLAAFILTLHLSGTRANVLYLSLLANVIPRWTGGGQPHALSGSLLARLTGYGKKHLFHTSLSKTSPPFPTSAPFRRDSPSGLNFYFYF